MLPSLLLALAIVAAYLKFGLPRLSGVAAFAITLIAALAMLLAPSVFRAFDATAAMLAITSLLAGHCGWLLGRRSKAYRQSTPEREKKADAQRDGADSRLSSQTGKESDTVFDVTLRIPPDQLPAVPAVPAVPGGQAPAAAQSASSAPAPQAARSRSGVAMSDLSRTSLGRYRIDRVIGRGSMGVVYLGLDPMLGRQVAIKTMALGREFAGAELDEAKQRFFREAETAGRLQHRDIVTIYDVGEEQDLAYIAMEFLKGQDLQRHTNADKLLPVPVVLRVGIRVAEALAYAHTRGVVHRDVKPANVMLHLPTGAVKVTDFGIARVTDASRTRTGTVLGTPSFMSPEHLCGQRTDGRSDLYSLGVMLFQLLTGQLPFQADSMAKLMYRIANDVAPDVRSLRPDLPETLAEVLNCAMRKDPASRFADGSRMSEDLRTIELPDLAVNWLALVPAAAQSEEAGVAAKPAEFASTVRFVR